MTKYTFLLPAYKGRYLAEMLHSIQNQTFVDFKVLVSDDDSPDNLYTICQPFLKDNRFTYRRNDSNIGVKDLVAHWNLLVDLCDSEYLILASDDDFYAPDFLKEIDSLIVNYPHVSLFRSRVNKVDDNGILLAKDGYYEEYVNQLLFIAQCYNNVQIKCVSNYVYKTKELKKAGGFVPFPLAWSSDLATAIMMSKNGCVNTGGCYFNFRQSGLNISSKHNSAKESSLKVEGLLQYFKWLNILLDEISVDDKYEETTLKFVQDKHREEIQMMIKYDIIGCKTKDFIQIIRRIKKMHLDVSYIFLYYFKKRIYKLTHI